MRNHSVVARLSEKTPLHAMEVELQKGYSLSPIEALVLARRVQQLVEEQTGQHRQPGQITYQAIAVDEPAGKALKDCRKVPVHLSVIADGDARVQASKGVIALRQLRVRRLVYEALFQDGALSQEDLACILGVSLKSIKRIFAYYRQQGEPLPSRGEIRDMGRGVSHKVPVIRKYVQGCSFSRISLDLGKHGVDSMSRYLRHFALVMILEERDLTPGQMHSVIGISENLIQQYRALYIELNVPEYARMLKRLKQTVFPSHHLDADSGADEILSTGGGEKRGLS